MVEKDTKLKILVIGSQGLLGSEAVRILSQEKSFLVKGTSHQELDITHGMETAIWLERFHPDFVIHCAALSNVDYCETHPEETFKVNSEGVRNLCLPLAENGGKLIHISTDYVFDGKKESPYVEEDSVNPLSVYAESKLKAEEYVKRHLPDSLIVRVQWLYGERGKSFSSQLIREITQRTTTPPYSLLEDRIGSPTCVRDIAYALKALMQKNASGLFHVSSQGYCSWVEFGETIFKLNGISSYHDVIQQVREDDLKRSAKRPSFTPFDCHRLEKTIGHKMPLWKESLSETIRNISLKE